MGKEKRRAPLHVGFLTWRQMLGMESGATSSNTRRIKSSVRFIGVGVLVVGAIVALTLLRQDVTQDTVLRPQAVRFNSVRTQEIVGDPHRYALSVSLDEAAYVAVAYRPVMDAAGLVDHGMSASAEGMLEKDYILGPTSSTMATDHDIIVYRLRASWTYEYVLLTGTSADDLAPASEVPGTFITAETDFEYNVCENYGGEFTFETILVNFHDIYGIAGLVALDHECYVVWYHSAVIGDDDELHLSIFAFEQTPDGNIVTLQTLSRMGVLINIVTPDHETLEEYWNEDQRKCWEDDYFDATWHHEVAMDPFDDNDIYFLNGEVLKLYGEEYREGMGIFADTFSVLHRDTGTIESVYSLADYVSYHEVFPIRDKMRPVCDMPEGVSVIWDWCHGNTLKPGYDDNLIYSSKYFDTVYSFAKDGSGLQFSFGRYGTYETIPPGDVFSGQHGVRQLPNGNIFMFDNDGWKETLDPDRRETARGVEWAIDHEAKTATKVWEYEPEVDFKPHCCGDVHLLDSGNRIVAFGGYSSVGSTFWTGNLVAEVDENENKVGWLEIRLDDRMLYRSFPSSGLSGETTVKARSSR